MFADLSAPSTSVGAVMEQVRTACEEIVIDGVALGLRAWVYHDHFPMVGAAGCLTVQASVVPKAAARRPERPSDTMPFAAPIDGMWIVAAGAVVWAPPRLRTPPTRLRFPDTIAYDGPEIPYRRVDVVVRLVVAGSHYYLRAADEPIGVVE